MLQQIVTRDVEENVMYDVNGKCIAYNFIP
jgi:hypothetical protein